MSLELNKSSLDQPSCHYCENDDITKLITIMAKAKLPFPDTPRKCKELMTTFINDKKTFVSRENRLLHLCEVLGVDPAATNREKEDENQISDYDFLYNHFRPDQPSTSNIKSSNIDTGVPDAYDDFRNNLGLSEATTRTTMPSASGTQSHNYDHRNAFIGTNEKNTGMPRVVPSPSAAGPSPQLCHKNKCLDGDTLAQSKLHSSQSQNSEGALIPLPRSNFDLQAVTHQSLAPAPSSTAAHSISPAINDSDTQQNLAFDSVPQAHSTPLSDDQIINVNSIKNSSDNATNGFRFRFTGPAAVEKIKKRQTSNENVDSIKNSSDNATNGFRRRFTGPAAEEKIKKRLLKQQSSNEFK